MMMGLIFWLIFILMTGRGVIALVTGPVKLLSTAEEYALSYVIGIGMITLWMALLSVLRIPFTVAWLILPASLLIPASVIMRRKAPIIPDIPAPPGPKFTASEKLLILAIAFMVLYAFFRALIKPIESYDSIAFWALKAKIFYLAGAIPGNFLTDFNNFVPHLDYPLLVPLAETSLYTFMGSLNDQLVKIIFPCFYLSAIVIFYRVVRRITDRRMSFVFTFMLGGIPQMGEHAAMGYADLPIAVYFSASFFYLFLWMRERKNAFLWLSFLLSVLAVWTKPEGFILFIVNLTTVILCLAARDNKFKRAAGFYITGSILFLGSVIILKQLLGLPFHSDFVSGGISGSGKFIGYLGRIPAILYEYQRQFFGPKKWNIVWVIFLALFAVKFRLAASKDIRPVTIAIMLCLLFYAAIFLVTPINLIFHLGNTSRLFIHFVPIVVLWIALVSRSI